MKGIALHLSEKHNENNMESLKGLRRRIRSIQNTHQITGAMEMVSAAKLRRTEHAWHSAKPYADMMRDLLFRMLFVEKEAEEFEYLHPFTTRREGGKTCLVIIASDRGFCAAFNANIFSRANDFIERRKQHKDIVLYCIGRRAVRYFSRREYPLVGSVPGFSVMDEYNVAGRIADNITSLYREEDVNEVYILFTRFISRIHHYPHVEKILPLTRKTLSPPKAESTIRPFYPILEPDMETILDRLLPAYLHSYIYIMLLESLTSEHTTRMIAMSNATRNSESLVDDLTLRLNKARQNSITRELLDIVGGSETFTMR